MFEEQGKMNSQILLDNSTPSGKISNECQETQTEVIPGTNKNKGLCLSLADEKSNWKQANSLKRAKTHMTKSRLFFSFASN